MVRMGVAEEDGADLAVRRRDDVVEVAGILRARIEHDEPLIRLDEVSVRAVIGHQARIIRDDAPDAWQNGQGDAPLRLRFLEKSQSSVPPGKFGVPARRKPVPNCRLQGAHPGRPRRSH